MLLPFAICVYKDSNKSVFLGSFRSPDSNENPGGEKHSFSRCKKRLKGALLHLRKTSFVVRNCSV